MRKVDVERRSAVGRDLFYAAAATVFLWIGVWGYAPGLWPLAIVGTISAAVYVGWSLRHRVALGTVLDGETLVERRQRGDVLIPVLSITAIDYIWVPYVGGSLLVRSRSGETIQLQLGSVDRIKLGRLLRSRQPMLSFAPRVERELGYYD